MEIAGRSSSGGLNAGSGPSANESSDLPACVALVDLPQSGPLFVGAEVGAVGASWVAGHHPGVLLVGSAITRSRRAGARPNRADLSLIDGICRQLFIGSRPDRAHRLTGAVLLGVSCLDEIE